MDAFIHSKGVSYVYLLPLHRRLYGERAGCLHIVVPDEAATVPVHSQASLVARRIWSNPPMHGAKIAAEIFSNDDLLRLWKSEVEVRAKVQGVAAQLFFT